MKKTTVIYCPYCGKKKEKFTSGKYQCTRCKGKFQISENGQCEEIGNTNILIIIGICALPGAIVSLSVCLLYELSETAEKIIYTSFLFFLTVFSAAWFLNALATGVIGIRSSSKPVYREDDPVFFIIALICLGCSTVFVFILFVIQFL